MMNDYIECDDCIYQSKSGEICTWVGRLFRTCKLERAGGNCGKSANHFAPKKHDPQVHKWEEICENCTKIIMVITGEIKTDKYDDLTIGEFREQYPCLDEDCLTRELYGSDK